jgi:DNA-binding CsgD family transcriptional regulator
MMDAESLTQCRNVEELRTQATAVAKAMGFDFWVYSAKVLSGSKYESDWSIHNAPEELWQAYVGCNGTMQDPIPSRSRLDMTPRVWVLDAPTECIGNEQRKTHHLYQSAQSRGVVGGLCVPVHDVAGAVGTLTLATCEPVSYDALMTASASAVLFSKFLHIACGRCVIGAQQGKGPSLSPRELECLGWAAKGKTSWEISRVLTISEHTAIFHLRNAAAKLGTVSRQQAVARSIQLGLVGNAA